MCATISILRRQPVFMCINKGEFQRKTRPVNQDVALELMGNFDLLIILTRHPDRSTIHICSSVNGGFLDRKEGYYLIQCSVIKCYAFNYRKNLYFLYSTRPHYDYRIWYEKVRNPIKTISSTFLSLLLLYP